MIENPLAMHFNGKSRYLIVRFDISTALAASQAQRT
jgi:hypothetical protein